MASYMIRFLSSQLLEYHTGIFQTNFLGMGAGEAEVTSIIILLSMGIFGMAFNLNFLTAEMIGDYEVRHCIAIVLITWQGLFLLNAIYVLCRDAKSLMKVCLNCIPVLSVVGCLALIPQGDPLFTEYAVVAYFSAILSYSCVLMRLIMCILSEANFATFQIEAFFVLPFAIAARLGFASVGLGIATVVVSLLIAIWFALENAWHLQICLAHELTWTIPPGTIRKKISK